MKFTHNDRNPAGHHYDAIIKDEVISIDGDEDGGNLSMLSAVASKQPKVKAKRKSTVENKYLNHQQVSALCLIHRL